jgi:uncharacterized protein (DUF305 family)
MRSSTRVTTCALTFALATAGCAAHTPAAPPAPAPAASVPAAAAPSIPGSATDPMAGHAMSAMAGHDMAGMSMAGMNMPDLPATAGPGYTVADVHFMQNMIGHHAQAIIMSGMATSHGAGTNVAKLAQKIAISQRDEIGFMKRWLTERKQVIPTDSQSLAMMMPGMLTPAMMKQLDAAHAAEFDRLFLTFMIGHHEGAIMMVKELFDAPPAGQDPEIFRFATDVDTDQRSEIFVMHELLDLIR